jgi:hypothetical protein
MITTLTLVAVLAVVSVVAILVDDVRADGKLFA